MGKKVGNGHLIKTAGSEWAVQAALPTAEVRAEAVLALILGSAGLKRRLIGGQVSERQGVGFLAFLCLKISLALKKLLLTRPLLLVSDSSAVRWGCGCLLSVYKLDSLFLSKTVSNRLVQK